MAAAHTTTAPTRRDPAPVIWGVAGTCWVATFALTLAGDMRAGAHDYIIEQSPWPWPVKIVAFLAVWVVMLCAMMLPTTTTMARLFTAVSANQERPLPSRTAFYASYLLLWSGFALVALAADTRVHWAVDHWAWLAHHTPVILGGTLLVAGAYQLSPLKDACLRACRSPMAVIALHYQRGARGGWRVGVSHARNCLGCCWALMLVMFATGVGSLAWMLGLSAVMLFEKTSRYGQRLVRPVAVALLAAGVTVVVPVLT